MSYIEPTTELIKAPKKSTLPKLQREDALLLDFDGTLVDIVDVPDRVELPSDLVSVLLKLRTQLDCAVCIITGRSLPDLRRHLPVDLDVYAEHGAVVALRGQAVKYDKPWPFSWSSLLDAAENSFPGLLVERKHSSVSLHYRLNPSLELKLFALADQLCSMGPRGFHVVSANKTIEIVRRRVDKGHAVAAVMANSHYLNRRPIYLGDSAFDYPAFKKVQRMKGVAINVSLTFDGKPSRVREWLRNQILDDNA